MPPQERSHRYQSAALWLARGTDAYGNFTVYGPVDIRVRLNTNRRETLDRQGNQIVLDATAIVDRQIPVGSKLWLAPDPSTSAVTQWNEAIAGTGTGTAADSELYEVKTASGTVDIKNRVSYQEVGLMRYHNRPPS